MITPYMGKLIKKRKEQKISQQKLSQLTNIPQTTISEWERGNSSPDILRLTKIANALNTTIVDILND